MAIAATYAMQEAYERQKWELRRMHERMQEKERAVRDVWPGAYCPTPPNVTVTVTVPTEKSKLLLLV